MTRPFKLGIPWPVSLNWIFRVPPLWTVYSVTRPFELYNPWPATLNCIFHDPPLWTVYSVIRPFKLYILWPVPVNWKNIRTLGLMDLHIWQSLPRSSTFFPPPAPLQESSQRDCSQIRKAGSGWNFEKVKLYANPVLTIYSSENQKTL